MQSDVFWSDILSAQIQPNAAKLSWVFEGQTVEYSAMAKSITWSQPEWACISLVEDKTNGRKNHKQTTTETSCSKGLESLHKGGSPVIGDSHEFQA